MAGALIICACVVPLNGVCRVECCFLLGILYAPYHSVGSLSLLCFCYGAVNTGVVTSYAVAMS